jgi:predicted nuclease of predicted toxin-antitoxin system
MRPRFLLDEHLQPALAKAAIRAGLDVVAVAATDLRGRNDVTILRAAIAQGRILVSYNARHFIPLLRDFIRSGVKVPGLVTISSRTLRSNDFKGLLRALIKLSGRIERAEVNPSMGVTLTR